MARTHPKPTKPDTPATPSRAFACEALEQHARSWPDLAPIDLNPRTKELDNRDAALTHAIVHAAIRRWITLAFLFENALARPWSGVEPAVQAALLAGGAQLLLLDKVPEHAAVDESVRWIKSTRAAKAASVVNAGLRALLRMRDAHASPTHGKEQALALTLSGVLPPDPVLRLSVTASVPGALVHEWIDRFGVAQAKALCAHALCEAPTTFNTEFYEHARGITGIGLIPHELPFAAIAAPTASVQMLATLSPGLFVQDAAAQRVVRAARACVAGRTLPVKPTIIDVCAGMGTKARQLAATFPHATIIATDSDDRRITALRAVAALYPNMLVRSVQAVSREFAGKADLVLLDVPCSNTGVLPRRPEARYRVMTDQLSRLVPIQRSILTGGATLLAKAGVLVYSTCSVNPRENTMQAQWACEHLGLKNLSEELRMPRGTPGSPNTQYHDGAYHAMLARDVGNAR